MISAQGITRAAVAVDNRWRQVRGRLIEAARVDVALPGRLGPKSFGSAMPEYVLDYPRGGRTKSASLVSIRDVSLADEARSWPASYVTDESDRLWLQLYVSSRAFGWSFSGACEHEEVSRHQALDVVERACRVIVAGLDRDRVVLR